jgi:hypothetical protein
MALTPMTAVTSSPTRTIASLAIVLVCLFKTGQYAVSVHENPVFPAYVCELIDETLPWYGIPFFGDGGSPVEKTPFDSATLRLDKAVFAILEWEFSHGVGLRLGGQCRISHRQYSLSWLTKIHHSGSSDEAPAHFFS